ncbi:Stk1 family PASTA domain-containing Ser/Thr kinase [Halobacillus litoralis]|uniref:Serine/threonine-protein kinase PrkC n=1 Tax=Halobacillus litoralis TaxID=45668 RepID=A0A845FBC1_9BACI|nr:Stk1 family PASTA domain-containing Ser/Thr kinase [Halobacillus litoralis]MYL70915.1 Stk1 family PASTA domain-containing Ser/Thr kinase [Halobacillus litoralis]
MLNNRLLNDRYRVQEMIGGGGMANVYLAYDTILDREVAIKVLRLEHGNDEEFIARFHREAQSATSLSHPNIVNIYDVGEEDDIYFMVMEYVDGMTLKQYIQQYSPVDVSEAVDIMKQIASAIAHAHDNGIVHRDIKPQNILIDHYGHVKVTDFGIAMALSATALTQTNSVLGSVHYLSPEQARGGMATKKSDVYSLGIVFFELLTGRLPFSGESPVSIALKHLQHETPSLRRWNADLPQSVENIVLKSTAKDPFHRYESVLEMEHEIETSLEPYRADEPVFTLPDDGDEEKTKAIPVITNEAYGDSPNEDTIINTSDHKPVIPAPASPTKNYKETAADPPPPEKKQKKKRKVWPWILTVILLLLIGGLVALFTIPGIIQPADVEIPDLAGEEYEAAYSELSDLNLNVTRETRFSDEVEEGDVIETDPEAGMTVKEGSEVTVYLSNGKERLDFPDYAGKDYEQVKEELESKGYSGIDKIEQTSEEQEAGEIIAHVSPSPGTSVIPDETTVTFRVSSGVAKVELASLVDANEKFATDYLQRNSLQVETTREFSEDIREGNVIRQDPAADTEVEQGSTVNLVISRGPEPKPPRDESISIEVPYEPEKKEEEGQDDGGQEGEQPEPEGQEVLIYVNDANRDGSTPVISEMITETKTFEITLTIEPGESATYRVMRDGEVFQEEVEVPY